MGIGTTSPGAKLEVTGSVLISNGTNGTLNVAGATTLNSTLSVGGNIYVNDNVGIGTTTPGAALQVNGDILFGSSSAGYTESGSSYIGKSSNTYQVGVDGFSGMEIRSHNDYGNGAYSQDLRFWTHNYGAGTGGTPRMTIKENGYVGIGTQASEYRSSNNKYPRLEVKSWDTTACLRLTNSNSNYWDIWTDSWQSLCFLHSGNYGFGYLSAGSRVYNIDFTGQHRAITKSTKIIDNTDNYIGLIVSSTGKITSRIRDKENNIHYMKSNKEAITVNEAIPEVDLSNKINDKKCFGIISDKENKNSDETEYASGMFVTVIKTEKEDTRLYINSVGEGAIWISNINGNIENGDYITTSNIAGYGMKQNDDILHNYTVAKATMDCTFDNKQTDQYETRTVTTEDGTKYIAAFIACTYHCG